MTERRARIHKGWLWKVLLAVGPLFAGCGADVGGGSAANNGQTLCYSDYVTCINPIFNAAMQNRTGQTNIQCASGGCHEVGAGFAGSLRVYPNIPSNTVDPTELSQLQANFISSLAIANLGNPVSSKLLLKPLVGNNGNNDNHTGGDLFPNNMDPCYSAVLAWITNSVPDQADPACGNCIPPVLASCGYP
jgi:hypothetical protein